MTLRAPNLDDRRFQDLVDEAKRMVQQRCPEWSDHNVSDPGVTLIETFASMVDQLSYRLNQVPDRLYVTFLNLLGLQLFPPTAAQAAVTFWLSAPQTEPVVIPEGTEVATVRSESEEAVSFMVLGDLTVPPCKISRIATVTEGERPVDRSGAVDSDDSFNCFSEQPRQGDCMFLGLSTPIPSCAVLLRFNCEIQGVGVDPRDPPLTWEAWNGERWVECDVDRDETGGFNKAGDVVLHLPPSHAASVVAGQRAGWLRCRLLPARAHQPTYSSSPKIVAVTASTIAGTATVVHSEVERREVLGISEGVAGQRFLLRRRPVVPTGADPVLEVSSGKEWQKWIRVESFAASQNDSHHFKMDETAGEVVLGPAVREPDGSVRQYGAIPPAGATLRIRSYRTGGGQTGNVAQGSISVLKSSLPYITRIGNRERASGGVDGETVDEAKIRGPMLLRTHDRAVTVDDYEQLARRAAPNVARVRCVPAHEAGQGGAVRILVVPSAGPDSSGRLAFEQLVPPEDTLARIADYLEHRRVVGARVLVEPPVYQGVTVVARLRVRSRWSSQQLRTESLEALYRYFDPLRGGPDYGGWPFGRPINVGEVYAVLQSLAGLDLVEDARLFPADPISGSRGEAVSRLEIAPDALVFSYEHQVRVQ